MASYTTSLRLVLPSTGDYPGTWGDEVNNSLTSLVDKAVAGTTNITMTAANYTLTNANGVADEAKAMFLVLGGTPGASYFVIVPTTSKLYFVTNSTGFAQSVSTSGVGGVSIPNGASVALRCNGVDIVVAQNYFGPLSLAGNLSVTGAAGTSNETTPELYGAVGNGITDDTTAVQAAITTGKDVIFTAGKTYKTTAALSVTSNFQRLYGAGVLAPSGAINGVEVNGATGVELSLNFNSSTHSGGYCVYINNSNRIKVSRLNIVDGFGAVYIKKANTVSIDWAWGTCRGPGIVWYGDASNRSDILVIQNVVLGVGATQYALDWNGDCHSLEIKYFGHIGGKGIIVRNTTGGSAPAIGRFTHIESDYSTACGVEIAAGLDFDITTAYINGAALDGIRIGASINDYNVRISGGKSIGNTGYGINNLGGVVLYDGTTDLSLNTAGESNGNLWAKPKRVSFDTENYITLNAGNPLWALDATDYISYDRANNKLNTFVGGASITSLGVNETIIYNNLLVGTTSATPSSSLGVIIDVGTGNTSFMHTTGTVSGTLYQGYYLGGVAIGSITQNGTTGVLYNISSDQRLKANIVDAPDASALIDSIKVRSFDWLSDASHQRYGFVAQELVVVAPEAVYQPVDPNEMMAVDYSKLVPMLVKELQSLRARVAALES